MNFGKLNEEYKNMCDLAAKEFQTKLTAQGVNIKNTMWSGMNNWIVDVATPKDKTLALSLLNNKVVTVDNDWYQVMEIKNNKTRFAISF